VIALVVEWRLGFWHLSNPGFNVRLIFNWKYPLGKALRIFYIILFDIYLFCFVVLCMHKRF
jgi:hypothetical protein